MHRPTSRVPRRVRIIDQAYGTTIDGTQDRSPAFIDIHTITLPDGTKHRTEGWLVFLPQDPDATPETISVVYEEFEGEGFSRETGFKDEDDARLFAAQLPAGSHRFVCLEYATGEVVPVVYSDMRTFFQMRKTIFS